MEFLVSMHVTFPAPDVLSDEDIRLLYEAEGEVAQDYIARGLLRRVWRIPGSQWNWMLWDVADATQLHRLLKGFPLYRMCPQIDVHPLADNHNDPVVRAEGPDRIAMSA